MHTQIPALCFCAHVAV